MAIVRAGSGSRLGPYELEDRLGIGGMAEVYVARRAGPRGFSKRVAIKRILPQFAGDHRFVAMFCDEARICAALTHPNIVQVVDFGEDGGELFMAMEYVEGVSCARLLRAAAAKDERFPVGAALYLAHEVLRALGFAHEARDEQGRPLGIVHRDVSPGNVLIGQAGEVKLTDFGIVRSDFVARRTYPGELKGKMGYMSPEQALGTDLDRRSDLFTVGIILAEMLLVRPLFPGGDEMQVLTRIHDADISVLERHADELPEELYGVLKRALAREPARRFQTAGEFAAALQHNARLLDVRLDETELLPWLNRLDVMPSSSGTREAVSVPAAETLPAAADRHVSVTERSQRVLDSLLAAEAPSPIGPALVAPTPRPPPPSRAERFHLRLNNGTRIGPVSLARLVELVATGRLDRSVAVSRDGIGWEPLRDMPEIARLVSRPAYRFFEHSEAGATWRRPLRRNELPAICYRLIGTKATGLLVVQSGRAQQRMYFVNGVPRYAATTEREGLLGVRIVDAGKLTPRELDRVVQMATERAQRLGEVLVELGYLTSTELLRALVDQLTDRFTELGAWPEGRLSYFAGMTSGEPELPAPMGTYELVTQLIRANYGPTEIARLVTALGDQPIARAAVQRPSVERLGLDDGELGALLRAAGQSSLRALLSELESHGVAPRDRALRAVFIGLSAGVLASPGWQVTLPL